MQKQMEEHTVTVHESMTSWIKAEDGLVRLDVHNNGSAPPTDADNATETDREGAL